MEPRTRLAKRLVKANDALDGGRTVELEVTNGSNGPEAVHLRRRPRVSRFAS